MKKKIMMVLSVFLCFSFVFGMTISAENINNKKEVALYDGYADAPDFGKYFGVNCISKRMGCNHVIDTYQYNQNDVQKSFLNDYTSLLKEYGFELKSQDKNYGLCYYENEKNHESIVVVIKDNQINVYISKRR